MRDFLQELAGQNASSLVNLMDQMGGDLDKSFQGVHSKSYSSLPSVRKLSHYLSNWIAVFVPPTCVSDVHGDMMLFSYLDSTDRHVSALATKTLEHREFNTLGV